MPVDDRNLESLHHARLSQPDRSLLLIDQHECTFVFATPDGWPCGVVMNYLYRADQFLLTSVQDRPQVAALVHDPRVSIVVSSAGTTLPNRQMLSFRGRATVLRSQAEVQPWLDVFADAWAAERHRDLFRRQLDSANRVVIKVDQLVRSASYDHRRVGRSDP
ncbi:MAG: pyridoxamine 5'-phosphate oxidase family protein [Nostocoides sp.]